MNLKNMLIIASLLCLPIACSNGDQDKKTASEQSATTPQNIDCGQLLNDRCTKCHQLTRICEKLGKKSNSQWENSISRMVQHGANINSAEKDALAQCLATQSDSVKTACQ